jgi:hypothetical protein
MQSTYRVVAGRQVLKACTSCACMIRYVRRNRIMVLDFIFQIADVQLELKDVFFWYTFVLFN